MSDEINQKELIEQMKLINKDVSKLCEENGIIIPFSSNSGVNNSDTTEIENLMEKYFFIPKENDPIYTGIQNIDDVNKCIKNIEEYTIDLIEKMNKFLDDNESECDEESVRSIDLIINLINKYSIRIKRLNKLQFDIDNIEKEFCQNLIGIIKNNFIETIIPSIIVGIKSNNRQPYIITIQYINKYLSNLGIYTYELKENEKMNYDLAKLDEESANNITNNKELKDIIKRINRYPYMFDNYLIVEGEASVWKVVN